MRLPKEVVKELHLDQETYVMLKWEAAGLVFSVLTVEKGREEKEGA
jgi:antitoxin component of MazEF toxin-antitoxin module